MSARLSPAASLLRNSKLFALPPQIALPAAPPSSDQVSNSSTATTVYPQFAAIETTSLSGSSGDWGFKRPLPLKATKSTSNPVVRLVRGIDTAEHVADFESAADHALTLRKFQQLNQPLRLPENQQTPAYNSLGQDYNVFRSSHDNTTNLSSTSPAQSGPIGIWPNIKPEEVFSQIPDRLRQKQIEVEEEKKAQEGAAGLDPKSPGIVELVAATSRRRGIKEQRRWRYAGPSLVQMSGMEFDDFVHNLGQKEKDLLVSRIKREIIRERLAKARDEGNMADPPREENVTQNEVVDYLRHLRNEPRKFGPILTEMLDIPEGSRRPAPWRNRADEGPEPWEYGRDTLAGKDEWIERGPPKTHPSAGLSYVHTNAHVHNHPAFGPQRMNETVVARAVKTKYTSSGSQTNYGVAGFIVPKPDEVSSVRSTEAFTPRKGGLKVPLRPTQAYITEEGALRMHVTRPSEYVEVDGKVIRQSEAQAQQDQKAIGEARQQPPASAPQMSGHGDTYRSRARQYQTQEGLKDPSQDVDSILAAQMRRPRRP